ncbi:MAG: methyltransferase domain-containing protein, partial [Burkholderiales bacterium]
MVALGAQAAEETPYVPTPQPIVDAMLNVAKVRGGDYLIDLGSGDGRIVITAAKRFGVRGFGVDLDTRLVRRAQEAALKEGVADRAKFYARDLFQTDLAPATVITMYLLPDVNLELRERILALKPGTRIVTHDYDFGDWRPDDQFTMPSPG